MNHLEIENKARQLVAAGEAPTIDDAIESVMTAGEYHNYLRTLSGAAPSSPTMGSSAPPRQVTRVSAAASKVEDRARQLVEAGESPTLEDALDKVFATDPGAYRDYLATLA